MIASDDRVAIEVRDTGIGIPEELLPRVFDLFVQDQRSLDRARGGLGIGLPVVKGLIEMHGGEVAVRSDGAGRGSVFTVSVPRAAPPGPRSASDVPDPALFRQRILVVDDNVDAADSLAMLLTLDGHEVETVYSATAALAAIEAHVPDVVLLDIGMPQMDGYGVARRVRSRATGNATRPRIVAVTGYGQQADHARGQAAGFDAHLTKPVDLESLARILSAPDVPFEPRCL